MEDIETIEVSHLGAIKMNALEIQGILMQDEPNLEIIKHCAQEILSACMLRKMVVIKPKGINYKKSLVNNQKLYAKFTDDKKEKIIDTIYILVNLLEKLSSMKKIDYPSIIEVTKKINCICINTNCNLLAINQEIRQLALTIH